MAPVIEGYCPKCKLYNYMVKECFFCGHVFIKDEKRKGEKSMKLVVGMYRDDDLEDVENFATTKEMFLPLHLVEGDRRDIKAKVCKWVDALLNA